jgi:hypothetical protein
MRMMMMLMVVTLLILIQSNFRTGRRGQTALVTRCADSVYPFVLSCELT